MGIYYGYILSVRKTSSVINTSCDDSSRTVNEERLFNGGRDLSHAAQTTSKHGLLRVGAVSLRQGGRLRLSLASKQLLIQQLYHSLYITITIN